jgi:hypothetical protein
MEVTYPVQPDINFFISKRWVGAMDLNKKDNENKVIRLDEQRRRKSQSKSKRRFQQKHTSQKAKPQSQSSSDKPKWSHYLQFILFLAFLAFAFQQCG